MGWAAAVMCAVVLGAAGCAPALDWREIRAEGGAAVLLPCKPSVHARAVELTDQRVEWSLKSCSASDVTWALGTADLVDPARVAAAMAALRHSAVANLHAEVLAESPTNVQGATPNAAAVRLRLKGRLPDGRPVEQELALFAAGTRVFQATAVGLRVEPLASETFFSSLRIVR